MSKTYGPYSPLKQAGELLFVSGQVGVNPDTKQAPQGAAEQTKQAFENLKLVLAEHGASLDSVVKTTIFLTSMDDYNTINEVYEQVFSAPRPARSTIGVNELPRVAEDVPLLVEVEAIAKRRL